MEYQSFGRYQKPKGSNIKQVLKLMIVLAICVWLLYQINHTETKNYGSQTKFAVGSGAEFFGRKGIMSQSDERAFPDSGKVDSVGEVADEFKSDDNEKEVQLRELQNDMHVGMNAKPKFSLKVKDEDIEENGIKEKGNIKMQKNVVESGVNDDEETNAVQSFRDENGVPPDVTEENFSTFSKVNWLKKINIYEVAYGEDNEVDMNLDELMNSATVDEEINAGSTTHVFTSGLQSRNKWR